MEKVTCTNCGMDNPLNSKYCSRCGHELPVPVPVVEPVVVEEETFTSRFNKHKVLAGVVFGIILFCLIGYGISHLISRRFLAEKFKSSAMDNVMATLVSEMNKQCPVMIDQYTRLDNIESLPGKTLQYNYTLIGFDQASVSAEALKENIEPQLVNTIKTNPQMQVFRMYKTTFVYNYKDEAGNSFLKISVTPDQYE